MLSRRLNGDLRLPSSSNPLILSAILAVWLVVVGYGAYNHVVWRDEARALSLALEAHNFFSIPGVIQGEGHPTLWYFLLAILYSVFKTNFVLQYSSFALATLGVGLFLWKAPFSIVWKCLFIFSGLAAFEYSVMARDYALIMPLFFGITMAMVAKKRQYWLIAVLIFMAMQADIYATLLAPLFVLVMLEDFFKEDGRGKLGILACGIVAAVGLIVAVMAVYPSKHVLVTESLSGRMSVVEAIYTSVLIPGMQYISLLYGHDHLSSLASILDFTAIGSTPVFFPITLVTILVYMSCIGLLDRVVIFSAALLGLWVTSIFSLMVYPMFYRHAGVWLIFIICLYWIRLKAPPAVISTKSPISTLSRISWWSLTLILILDLSFGVPEIWAYSIHPNSVSRALAGVLRQNPTLYDAIIMPEPGEMGESLAYYAPNPIYMVREGKFGRLANWTKTSTINLSLNEMMDAAHKLRCAYKKPIVIILEHAPIPGDHFSRVIFGRSFQYTQKDYEYFIRATRPLTLGPAFDETYSAYLLPAPSTSTPPRGMCAV